MLGTKTYCCLGSYYDVPCTADCPTLRQAEADALAWAAYSRAWPHAMSSRVSERNCNVSGPAHLAQKPAPGLEFDARGVLVPPVAPDFEALRAKRNAGVRAGLQRFADRLGVPRGSLALTFNEDSCYCACATGGPCEHQWDGPIVDTYYHVDRSVTCSRCGGTAMSHSMRTAP